MIDQEDRRGQIAQAALRVFARQGFRGGTIKRIAEEAGLRSPALIYWYFEDKEELLHSVIQDQAPIFRLVSDAELGDLPPDEVLRRLAAAYYEAFEAPEARQLFRVFMSEAFREPRVADSFVNAGPLAVLRFLVSYLERQMERGVLRPHDPEAGARAFMGMLISQVLTRELFPALAEGLPSPSAYAEEAVGIFLRGLEA